MINCPELKYLLLVFALSNLFFNCKTQKPLKVHKEKTFELGTYLISTALGGFSLEFKNDQEVVYYWNSDLFSFDRLGKFEISNDTIEINYEPLLEIVKYKSDENFSSFQFKNNKGQKLKNCNIKTFKKGNVNIKTCDKEGRIILDERIEGIDSIYLNWNFMDIGIYPIEHKIIPKSEIIEEFVQIEIILEKDLIGHPVSSNNYKLLIVGPNELYPGLDYDPKAIYLGGLLKKAGK